MAGIGNDVSAQSSFLASAVKEKIKNDLKQSLQESVINPLLDEVVENICSNIDLDAYKTMHPEQLMSGFVVEIKDSRIK